MRILVIEDDVGLTRVLKAKLGGHFVLDAASTGLDGSHMARMNTYDAIILDLVLPDVSGLEVCRNIREKKDKVRILVLTAEDKPELKVDLLDAGADDYITKPFSFPELQARLRALLRRPADVMVSNPITVGDLTIDTNKRTVMHSGKLIDLRRREFELLEYMMRHEGEPLSRGMILEGVWETNIDQFSNTVDVHINCLRSKIDRPFGTKFIKTVPGVGYKLEA